MQELFQIVIMEVYFKLRTGTWGQMGRNITNIGAI